MRALAMTALLFTATVSSTASLFGGHAMAASKPTVILVHGAFADASSWDGVVSNLLKQGYPVIALANPLRGVATDAANVSSVVRSVKGPVVLVGHSYGGPVISAAANGNANVKALVFVAAFAPDAGETASGLSEKFPGSSLGATLQAPVALADGRHDLYIDQQKFPAQFAADVPLVTARLMAVTQRPVAAEALNEEVATPGWKTLPSWFIYGSADLNIPPAAHAFMAIRAGARETIVVAGASHVVMISNPGKVSKIIEAAAEAD